MDIRHDESIDETALHETRHGPWPEDSLARVPYWVYQDEDNYGREMQHLFEGSDLELCLPGSRHPQQGRLPHQPCRQPAGDRGARRRRRRSTASRTAARIAAR